MASAVYSFHLQPVLSDLYTSRDLLDFTASSPITQAPATHAHAASSLFSSVSQFAQRATHPASPFAPPADSSPAPSSSTSPPPTSAASPSEPQVRCVEGYANNLYVGGTDGHVEWWIFDASAGSSRAGATAQGWRLQNRVKVSNRSISKIILLPKVGKCLVLTEGTLHPFALPSLDPILHSQLSPIRGVVSVVLNDDELDLGSGEGEGMTDMTVVVLKRKGLLLCRLGTGFRTIKEMPLTGATRSHACFETYICAAIQLEQSGLTYCIIDLSDASMTELLPVSQVPPEVGGYKPNPNVVVIPGVRQFLVTIYTGANTMGVFLNSQGDPERGTIEWDEHPLSIAVESGYIIALLRNNTITIHDLDNLDRPTQVIGLDAMAEAFGLSYSPYGIAIRDVIRDERMAKVPFTLLSGKLESSSPLPSWGIPALGQNLPQLPATLDEADVEAEAEAAAEAEAEAEAEAAAEAEAEAEADAEAAAEAEAEAEAEDGAGTRVVPDFGVEADAEVSDEAEPPSGSGLTPPTTPKVKPPPIVASTATRNGPFSSAVAETLLVGRHKLQGLTPTPAIIRLERLCAERKMDEAADLVDEERRKGRRGEFEGDKATHNATLRLLHLYLACHMLLETVFERAGDYLVRGKIDPRLVVRLFTKLRGKVIGTAEQVEVFEGIRPVLADMSTIDDIITDFINRHATSHTIAEKDELHAALYDSAKNMLTEFLSKTRTSRRNRGGARGIDSQKIDIVIDTTLAKLLADAQLTSELMTMLSGPNDVVLSELEPYLSYSKSVLIDVLRREGRTERVLGLLKEMAENGEADPLCPDPVLELMRELNKVDDPQVLTSYAIWLLKRDFQQGLRVLVANGDKINLDDRKFVKELTAAGDHDAANQYLEYAVIGKKATDRELHEMLLKKLLDDAGTMCKDDGIKYHIEELDAEYRLSRDPQAYPVFFAEIAPPTPFKTMRLKLMLMLQSSSYYDLDKALSRLSKIGLLVMERAIILGRQHKDRAALALLVRDLPDSTSAQTYCTQGGEILPPKVARMVIQHAPELASWMSLCESRRRRGTVDTDTQHRLVRELLGAYMRDGGNTARTAELLSAQGVHLDVLEVLDTAPKEWPLEVITTFYKRSVRRQLHERSKWQVLKSIAAGQNLETSERLLDAMSRIPPVVEDGPSGGDEEMSEKLDEKVEDFSEKPLPEVPESELSSSLPTKEVELQEMRPMTNL